MFCYIIIHFQYLLNKAIEVGARQYYPGAPEANAAALGVTKPIYKGKRYDDHDKDSF